MSRRYQPHFADPKSGIAYAPNGNILLAAGTAVPADGAAGYATGCVFMHTDGGAGTEFYVNQGSASSCDFNVLTGVNLAALLASAAELNQAADPDSQYQVLTAAATLTAADTNKTFYLNSATEFAVTLPAVAAAAGVRYRFVVKAAPSAASYTVVTAASENKIIGHVLTSQDAGGSADSETSGGDTLTFVDSKAVVGDMAELFCDGAFWYVQASSKVFDAITITTAS